MNKPPVLIDATNYRGERSTRKVYPLGIRYGTSAWHPTPCWLVVVHDIAKKANREFDLMKVHSMTVEGAA